MFFYSWNPHLITWELRNTRDDRVVSTNEAKEGMYWVGTTQTMERNAHVLRRIKWSSTEKGERDLIYLHKSKRQMPLFFLHLSAIPLTSCCGWYLGQTTFFHFLWMLSLISMKRLNLWEIMYVSTLPTLSPTILWVTVVWRDILYWNKVFFLQVDVSMHLSIN